MAETASCAGRGAGLASSACRPPRSSAPRQPAPRPATSSPRGSRRSGPSSRRAVRSRSTISPSCSRRGGSAAPPRRRSPVAARSGSMRAPRRPPGSSAQGSSRSTPSGGGTSSRAGTPIAITARASSVTAAATFASAAAGVGTAERAALLAWLPLTDRELAVYEGGLFEDAPGPRDRAARAAADDLGPRRGGRRRAAVPARQRASQPSGSPRSSATPTSGSGPSTHPAPSGRGPDRVAAAGGRAPGRERDRRLGLRARSPTTTPGRRAVVARQLARYASSALVGTCTRESGR